MPSLVALPVLLAASARPRSRRIRFAASRSPLLSWSAFLQSIIPAPVVSRSALTSLALTSAICSFSILVRGLGPCGLPAVRASRVRRSPLVGLGLGHGVVALGLLLGLELQFPLRLGLLLGRGQDLGRLARGTCGLSRSRVCFRSHRLALDHGVGNDAGKQCPGADRIVVTGDAEVDFLWITVRVQYRNDRDAELARLAHRDLLFLGVEYVDRVRQAIEISNAPEVARELLVLATQTECLLLRQPLERSAGDHLVEVPHALDAFVDRAEVREHAAEPPE